MGRKGRREKRIIVLSEEESEREGGVGWEGLGRRALTGWHMSLRLIRSEIRFDSIRRGVTRWLT